MKDNKLAKKVYIDSPVIIGYAAICCLMCILNYVTAGTINNLFELRHIGIQLATYFFVHSGFEHLFSNLLLLMLVGPSVEEKYGSEYTAFCITTTGILSGILNCLLFNNGVLGASGIVFLMIVLSAFKSFKDGKVPLTTIIVVVIYLGNEILKGVFAHDNVSQFIHIAGGVCGIAWGVYLNKKRA